MASPAVGAGQTGQAFLRRRNGRARAEALDRALAKLVPERIHESVGRHEKRQNVENTEKAVRRTAAFLIELYKLSGREDLVKRVRPVFRRRRKGGGKPQTMAVREEPSPTPGDEEIVRLPTLEIP